jgi:MoxR-like ATPase
MLTPEVATQSIQTTPITARLGVLGWSHLDAVIVAALATEAPLLLIGPHGTAKTWLVERLAQVLGLSFRHYNASLLNYDDLVGIPIPEEGNEQLRFITTPGAIWDAEFAFFDEISRCRPDLQNKLFPIIHEKRVVGLHLPRLRFRWAAMNPPSPDSPDMDAASSLYYLGSEPLDPALTDRFPFVIPVPAWGDLSREDRRLILRGQFAHNGTEPALLLAEIVVQCQGLIHQVEEQASEWLTDYLICAMDLLEKAKLPQSPRRARMLMHAITAIHAARIVLEGEDASLDESAELALVYGMPQTATEVPPAPATLVAIHKQAWEIANKLDDEAWRQILEEADVIKRVILAEDLQVNDEDLSRLITQALNVDVSEARKVGLATAIFLAFRGHRALTPAAWDPLVKLSARVLLPRTGSMNAAPNSPNGTLWAEIKPWALKRRQEGEIGQLEVNYVLGGFPELWQQYNWQESLDKFRNDLKLFGIKELNA